MPENLSAQEIADRLDPKHLKDEIPENPGDLKAEVKATVDGAEDKPDPEKNLKKEKEYTFKIHWTDPSGEVWAGEFTNQILSIRERQMAGVMQARLGGGMATNTLDPLTADLNLMIAHLEYSLTDRPPWASNFGDLHHVALIQKIYEEVASHEAIFLGLPEVT